MPVPSPAIASRVITAQPVSRNGPNGSFRAIAPRKDSWNFIPSPDPQPRISAAEASALLLLDGLVGSGRCPEQNTETRRERDQIRTG